MLTDVGIIGEINVIKKVTEKILNIYRPHNIISAHVEFENNCDTSYNRGDWIHFEITQTIPEKRTGEARN